jgi:phosphoribosylaminoimidazole-succinocarboxamide synthase
MPPSDLYAVAVGVAARAGILIADTKFEFGLRPRTNELLLIDELLTPDSSRFWDAAAYEPGRPQSSFDKQFVRDWLEVQPWDKSAPGPRAARVDRRGHARALHRCVRAHHGREFRALPQGGRHRSMSSHRFAVNVTPKPGILDPQGRAVEGSLDHLGIEGVRAVRVGRRVELTVDAADEAGGTRRGRAARLGVAREPADRGVCDRSDRGGRLMPVRIGVVGLPG